MTGNVIQIDLPQSDISFYPNFITPEDATTLKDILQRSISWQQDSIKVFGKTYPQPRLTALYGNNQKPYSYSNITMYPNPFTKELEEVKSRIETLIPPTVFSSCLLNLYRDGKDSNGWHADDEDSLGKDPVIASVSLGQERYFHFKNKQDSTLKHKILLNHGSLLIMKGSTQHHWLHQIPKTSRKIAERINLTFRVIN